MTKIMIEEPNTADARRPPLTATASPLVCVPDEHGHCHICSDEGIPAQVVALNTARNEASVEHDGQHLNVAIDLLEDVNVGDTVLVHAGFAIMHLEWSE